MKRLLAFAPLLILSCDMPPAGRREITIEQFINRRITRSVCEIRGRLTNTGDTELDRPVIGVEIYRGSQLVTSTETPLNIYPLPVGASVPFDIPYRCGGSGGSVLFSGRDHGRIISVSR